MSCRFAPLAVLLVCVGVASAEDLPPPSPLDLARGLREAGMADLALDYLDDLAKAATDEVKVVLPLERAKCKLDLASDEADDAIRVGLVTDAKGEFDAFVRANRSHPRLPEAAVALAQLQTIEGKGQIQRANRLPREERAGEYAKARPTFLAAAKQYEAAAVGLKAMADDKKVDPGTPRHRELVSTYLQARLDHGITLHLLADTYPKMPAEADAKAKAKAINDALEVFITIRDAKQGGVPDHPLAWVGRAWEAETLRLTGNVALTDATFKSLTDEAARARTPAAAAGLRVAKFFQLREEFVKGGHEEATTAERLKVRAACQGWLAEYGSGRPTTELYATRYYLGTVLVNEGLKPDNRVIETVRAADPKEPPTQRMIGVKEAGLAFLREADAQFRPLVRTENEYTERATRQRMRALRWLVGNPDRPPAQFGTFDECYMAALVQQERLREADGPTRDDLAKKVVALLERAVALPVPAESARDAARAALDLARGYFVARRPHAAAVYAEHLARTARSPAAAARAGALAIAAYQTAAAQTPPQNQDAQAVDRDRMTALGVFIEKAAPTDPAADEVRLHLGVLYSLSNRPVEMFQVLSRVSPRFAKLPQARLYQGVAAFELVRAADDPAAAKLAPDQRQEVFRRATADLGAVPAPTAEARGEQVSFYFNMRLQLAQLHLTQGAAGYPTAEAITAESAAAAASHPALSGDDKKKFAMRSEKQRLRAVYGQAMPLFAQGKYPDAAERFAPLLNDVLKAGPAVKENQPDDVAELARGLDADRIALLIVPTLNARVREGAVDKTAALLDELKKFGGDLSTTARVVQQAVASARPTVDALRRTGKADDAAKLISAVTAMVNKVAGEANLPQDVRLNLGKSFKDLGEYGKAVELLDAIPAPSDREALKGELKAKADEPPADKAKREADNAAAPLYRQARLELARAYRLGGQPDKAAEVLDDALGKEGEAKNNVKPRAGGWGTRYSDFRRESILLIEARAMAAEKPIPLWNEALANWRAWSGEYLATLNTLNRPYSLNKQKVERLGWRQQLAEELAGKGAAVNFAIEKAKAGKDLEQNEKDQDTAAADVAAAGKAFGEAAPADVETARAKLETARDTLDALAKKGLELKARPVTLDEFAKLPNPDWNAEAQKALEAAQALRKEMGDQERKMNPLKATWQDVLADQFRCLMAAQASALGGNQPKLAEFAAKHAKTIADFEKANRPLPTGVRQKLFELVEAHPVLKDEYRKLGGTDSLAPPSANQ